MGHCRISSGTETLQLLRRSWNAVLQDRGHHQHAAQASILHVEFDPAMRHALISHTRHISFSSRPRREDLTWHIHPPFFLCLHALALGKFAENIRNDSAVWSVCLLSSIFDISFIHYFIPSMILSFNISSLFYFFNIYHYVL